MNTRGGTSCANTFLGEPGHKVERSAHAEARLRLQSAYRAEAAGLLVSGLAGLAADVRPSSVVWSAAGAALLAAGTVAVILMLYAAPSRILRLPQARMHLAVGVLFAIAGLAQLLGPSGRTLVAPVALALGGVALLLHVQHGTSIAVRRATALRVSVGALLSAGATLVFLSHLIVPFGLMLDVAGELAVLAAGVAAFAYREPPGAFETGEMLRTHYMDVEETIPGEGW